MPVEINQNLISCPICASKKIKKHSITKAKLQTSQRYMCKDCKKTFILKPINSKNRVYPLQIILNSISYYNLGYPQSQIVKIITKKYKIKPPQKTISNWVNEYKEITTFNRLRKQIKSFYSPGETIENYNFLHNNLNYKFQIHKAKLNLFSKESQEFQKLKLYLEKILTKEFPHHIFKPNYSTEIQDHQRASQIDFKTLEIKQITKNNLANKLASLALNLAKTNKDRHEAIQNFILINDSTTIAAEIPVYLTNDDLLYFISRGFSINKEEYKTPITGHIDLLQFRNNLIHILDYKPEAKKIKPISQLTIYALALASRTKLPLKYFKCAWFDENNYFEFFPLHVVYRKV